MIKSWIWPPVEVAVIEKKEIYEIWRSLIELRQAFLDYEMGVDDSPPLKHKLMMARCTRALKILEGTEWLK